MKKNATNVNTCCHNFNAKLLYSIESTELQFIDENIVFIRSTVRLVVNCIQFCNFTPSSFNELNYFGIPF